MVIEQGLLIMTHEQVILLKNGELVILTEDLTCQMVRALHWMAVCQWQMVLFR